MEIFNSARIRFGELYQDAIAFIKRSYGDVGQHFTLASPMGQLLQVMLGYGRMILYYIEDSITELNIKTATRSHSIKGLATLTGHNPSRAIGARGTLIFRYNGTSLEDNMKVVTIPNYTRLINNTTGLTYTVVLPSQEAILNMTTPSDFIETNIVQGIIEYQQVTGTGDPLQSYNIRNKTNSVIDNYFVAVYVNGLRWNVVDSILDMTYDEKSVLVKTSQTSGIDIFFGNGFNGAMPPVGSTILIEYLLTDGAAGNINKFSSKYNPGWKFTTNGYTLNNEEIDLNKLIHVSEKNEIKFGADDEPIFLTRLLAPHTSRSFVLANRNNYIHFLRKLNMFSVIDAFPGYATQEDKAAKANYNRIETERNKINLKYKTEAKLLGTDNPFVLELEEKLNKLNYDLRIAEESLEYQKKDDNTIYLFLVPDINKRILPSENYFSCDENAFKLSKSEKTAIIDLIEQSGQRIVTVDNVILDLKFPRFVLNMSLILWQDSSYATVKQNITSKVSEYLLKNTRRDRIPVSDIISIVENVDGVDSVNVWFDADRKNKNIYINHCGIDSYGDILLERNIQDSFGNNITVNDIYPLLRGGFTNESGVEYADNISSSGLTSLNVYVRSYTSRDLNSNVNNIILTK